PARFIRDRQITVWSSVPSIATIMRRLGMLQPGAFPSLRYSVFSGDTLLIDLAAAWEEAAPHSRIENIWGITEATVFCIGAAYNSQTVPDTDRGAVPIGFPFPGTRAAVLDSHLEPLPPNQHGELALAGPH